MSVHIGMSAPDFSLRSQHYKPIRLIDFRGRFVVIYFYPSNDEQDSITEGCFFRQYHSQFEEMEAAIIGVSSDSQGSHIEFSEKWKI